jgi:chloramphenicol 3-O phosphotransferase
VGAERRGRIVVLNGTSSAGKTTLAAALQRALPGEYEVVGLDQTVRASPAELFVIVDDLDHEPVEGWLVPIREGVQLGLPRLGPAALEVLENMYASYAVRADSGVNLIVDDVLWHPRAIELAAMHFAERDAWLVDVHCPIEVAVERERRRGDRAAGGAVLFAGELRRIDAYDIRVDTSVLAPEPAAEHVVAALASGSRPTAFRDLRFKMG